MVKAFSIFEALLRDSLFLSSCLSIASTEVRPLFCPNISLEISLLILSILVSKVDLLVLIHWISLIESTKEEAKPTDSESKLFCFCFISALSFSIARSSLALFNSCSVGSDMVFYYKYEKE